MKKYLTGRTFVYCLVAVFFYNVIGNVIAGDPNKELYHACKTIGERISQCYTGSDTQCQQLREVSNLWFANEFGASHELLCPEGRPLTSGR